MSARTAERAAKLAKIYDVEIWPAYAARFATMVMRHVPLKARARVVEIGCATGHVTRELAVRLPPGSTVMAFDAGDAFVNEARARIEAESSAHAPVTFQVGDPLRLPAYDETADVVVSNLAVAAAADPAAAVAEIRRVLVPGGRAVITTPLRGSWSEFLDLFRDVLRESGRPDALGAIDAYVAALPDATTAMAWLEETGGLVNVDIEVERWEILFKTAREFFFSPLVELGPLSNWKRLAGAGDAMQDAFFFTKEAIDNYYKGRPFAVTVVGAVITAGKGRE
jgi:ubiquinone/menaquinone biosynthesis C-methylase UbiE